MSDVHEEVNAALQTVLGPEADGSFPPPFQQAVGIRWTAYEEKRLLHAEASVPADLSGAHLVWTMGLCSALFEWVALSFAQLLAHKYCMTLNLEFSGMRHAIADGAPLSIEVQIRATRKSIVFVEGVIKTSTRETVLHASASFAALKSRPGDRD